MSKLIFGCGYVGLRVAKRSLDADEVVFAVTRRPDRADARRRRGYRPIVADVTDPASLLGLPAVDTVLFAVGFDRRAGKSIQEVYVGGLRNVLEALPEPQRLIYISSTGVYGQSDGRWVDEASPTAPFSDGGKACLAAESFLTGHRLGRRATILRSAGIYGPGRVPYLDKLRAGTPLNVFSRGHLNLIHVDDLATVIVAVESARSGPGLYCASDGEPVIRGDYYHEIARLAGTSPPRFTEPRSPELPLVGRATTDKRIRNARLVADFDPPFVYPSYREGLASILSAEADGPVQR